MALSYKEMMFECLLNNESTSIKSQKSKKTYKKSTKTYKKSTKSLKSFKSSKSFENNIDNVESSNKNNSNYYKNYQYIKQTFDAIEKLKEFTKNDKTGEVYNIMSKRLVFYGINYLLLYTIEFFLLTGQEQLYDNIKDIIKTSQQLIKISNPPDFLKMNIEKIINFNNLNIKNNELFIKDFKLLSIVENNFLNPKFINLIDIFNRYFNHLLHEYDEQRIGFYIVNKEDDYKIKKDKDTFIDINNALSSLNYYKKTNIYWFDIYYQYNNAEKIKDSQVSRINNDLKVNIIINMMTFNKVDSNIFLKYMKEKLLYGGSVILFFTLFNNINSKFTYLIAKHFKKVIITKATLNTPNMWVLIGKGYIGDNEFGNNKKLLNFLIKSNSVHLNKTNDFYKNVFTVINKLNEYELIKEINKRYVEAYKWALQNNISVVNVFSDINKEPKLVPQSKLINYLFPNQHGVDKKQIIIFDVSLYSVTPPSEAFEISKTIKQILIAFLGYKNTNNISITDGTANVGGNTINFSKNFSKVNTIEINKNVFDALTHNCSNVYKLKNIKYYHGSCLDIIPNLNQDVIFIDPPWNGALYKAYNKLHLYLNKNDIEDVIDEWIQKKLAKLYVIKCPANYDFDYYIQKYKNTYIQKLRNYNIIYLYNNN